VFCLYCRLTSRDNSELRHLVGNYLTAVTPGRVDWRQNLGAAVTMFAQRPDTDRTRQTTLEPLIGEVSLQSMRGCLRIFSRRNSQRISRALLNACRSTGPADQPANFSAACSIGMKPQGTARERPRKLHPGRNILSESSPLSLRSASDWQRILARKTPTARIVCRAAFRPNWPG